MLSGVKYEEITGKGLTITTNEGKRQTIEADTILTVLPTRPNTELLKALENGVTGYLMKNTGREELVTAIRAVASGNSYLDNEASAVLMQYLQSPSARKESESDEVRLTPREKEVLKLIALEYSNAEIAEKLFISIRTVDTHRRNLIEKLKLKNTAGLVKWAIKNNLIGQE